MNEGQGIVCDQFWEDIEGGGSFISDLLQDATTEWRLLKDMPSDFDHETTIAELTEADFDGYALIAGTDVNAIFGRNADNDMILSFRDLHWQADNPLPVPNEIKGMVIAQNGATLPYVVIALDPPILIVNPDQVLNLTAVYNLTTNAWAVHVAEV